jgi:PHS family inorganic phosphate transporter-like MFS transporter
MASNFSAAYNTFNISLALALMRSSHPPHTSSDITSCSSAVIGGMIVGQLIGGLLGDWLGRHIAMAVVMCVQVISALMSAFSGTLILLLLPNNNNAATAISIYTELACWRFFLGFGCGGVYPLSATITAESSSQKGNRPRLLATMFSMQGVAYLAVPLITYLLVLIFGNDDGSDLAWRLLLGLGSLPGLILIATRLYRRRTSLQSTNNTNSETIKKQQQKTARHGRLQPTSMLEQIRNEEKLGHKLVGTAGCWLLFDILFYGNALFQPKVLQSAFGQSETELDLIRDAILIGLMALPGYLISIYMVGRQSPRRIQLQGFLCMALLYAYIGYNFDELNKYALLGLYGASFFFSNYGPNTTVSIAIGSIFDNSTA